MAPIKSVTSQARLIVRQEAWSCLQPGRAPVVARGDLGRRLAVHDREFLVVLQHDVVRIAEEALPVHENSQGLSGGRAVAAYAALRETHAPGAEELAEREGAGLR